MMFLNGCKSSTEGLMKFLDSYERGSGQKINKSESCFMLHHKVFEVRN